MRWFFRPDEPDTQALPYRRRFRVIGKALAILLVPRSTFVYTGVGANRDEARLPDLLICLIDRTQRTGLQQALFSKEIVRGVLPNRARKIFDPIHRGVPGIAS
jgi:hypothetical protein